jgi:hypothetical protein
VTVAEKVTLCPRSAELCDGVGVVTAGSGRTVSERIGLLADVKPFESVTVTVIEYVPAVNSAPEQVTDGPDPVHAPGSPVHWYEEYTDVPRPAIVETVRLWPASTCPERASPTGMVTTGSAYTT